MRCQEGGIDDAAHHCGIVGHAEEVGHRLRDATLVISMFFAGMVVARSALSVPAVGRQEPIRLIRAGIAVLVVGSVVVWASTSFSISLSGFLAMGIGSGVQFPLGIALALDTAPLQPRLAASRLALVSGLGILNRTAVSRRRGRRQQRPRRMARGASDVPARSGVEPS